ncbi:hypothetical protein NQ318_022527 [Aromia moschata]|uniref:Endonuclease/exonuclease/phosphatase domain-containing protein n=1 Tax=Aromia moschata TaxID=1265417 RepID=A0AAV8XLH2_9CUCU|nr:hypothetical protein NQ318_022527 [Aromia moschata]
MPKILQINVDRVRAAHDMLDQNVKDKDIDIVIVAEPNKKITKNKCWLTDNNTDAAIGIIKGDWCVNETGKDRGFVWVNYISTRIYSCYVSPNSGNEEYESFLHRLGRSVRQHRGRCIVAGDFNAKSIIWGAHANDQRGEMLVEWIGENNLMAMNDGLTPTFQRGVSSSYIDVTLVTSNLNNSIWDWRVSEEENMTHHNNIYYELQENRGPDPVREIDTESKGWKIRIERMEDFKNKIEEKMREYEWETKTPELITSTIVTICDKLFEKRGGNSRKRNVYWWNMEIGMMRTECTRKKRTLTRVNGRMTSTEEEKTEARKNYKVSKNALKKAIIRAKQEAWDRIVEDVENDIWGQGYKIVTKQFRKKNELPDHIIIEEAEKLFPRQVICDWNYEPINQKNLELAPQKTEAIILSGRRSIKQIKIEVMGREIETTNELKYLGLHIDRGMTMKSHITNTCRKAEISANALNRIMRNINGPSAGKRKLLSAVTHSIILYAAPIWHNVTRYKKYENMLKKAQRKVVTRICSAYRTISTVAALVISGTPPIRLQIRGESKDVRQRRGYQAARKRGNNKEMAKRMGRHSRSGTMDKEVDSKCRNMD